MYEIFQDGGKVIHQFRISIHTKLEHDEPCLRIHSQGHARCFVEKILPLQQGEAKLFPAVLGERGDARGHEEFFRYLEMMKKDEAFIHGQADLVFPLGLDGIRAEALVEVQKNGSHMLIHIISLSRGMMPRIMRTFSRSVHALPRLRPYRPVSHAP